MMIFTAGFQNTWSWQAFDRKEMKCFNALELLRICVCCSWLSWWWQMPIWHQVISHHYTDWDVTIMQHTYRLTSIYSFNHYGDVIMGAIASQITSLTILYSTVYSDADQRKHQSSLSLTFVWGIHRGPVNSLHKWPVTRKIFPFDDVIMPERCGSNFASMFFNSVYQLISWAHVKLLLGECLRTPLMRGQYWFR